MASPQLENGYIRIANELFEALCGIRISGEAMQVFNTIIRKTYGYSKPKDQIATSQFIEITRLSKRAIHRARKKLLDMNMISVTNNGKGKSLTYSIVKNYALWKPVPKKGTPLSVTNNVPKCDQKRPQSVTKKAAHKRHKDNIQKTVFSKDSSEYKLSIKFLQYINQYKPNYYSGIKKPTDQEFQSNWCGEIEKTIRRDNKPEDVEAVINWLHTADTKDVNYWKKQCLSPSAFNRRNNGDRIYKFELVQGAMNDECKPKTSGRLIIRE
ncbi:replication protein [candidate division KSB1 bacterium]